MVELDDLVSDIKVRFGRTAVPVEIDVTDLEEYVSQKRKEGIKITLTHIFTLAVAPGRPLRYNSN